MALVSCTRCGNPISVHAAACPRCGKPIDIVPAQLSTTPARIVKHELLAVRFLSWCRRHPIAIAFATYVLIAIPMLLVAFFQPDDETAASLTSLAIFPGALFGVGFGIWRALPDATASGKLQRIGWSSLFLLVAGFGIWLLANFQFAWYLLGAVVIAVVCYLVYLTWNAPQSRPAKFSNWYWSGVYLGAILIGAVSMHAGSRAAQRTNQANQPQGQVQQSSNGEADTWRKVIEGGLLLLGMYIIKQSSRAAVLAELSAEGRLALESTKPSGSPTPTLKPNTSLTSSQDSNP